MRVHRWPCGRVALCALVLLGLALTPSAEAAGSKESEITCYPAEIEPNEEAQCIINVRDTQREPTMSFNLGDFVVSATSFMTEARVTLSALSRGADITTIAFTVKASMGTELTITAEFNPATPTTSPSLARGPLRNSGLTVSVLTWPAVGLGAITCSKDVATNGLKLRDSTVCTAPLTDADGRPAVLHRSDVVFNEANVLGNFQFLSGKRVLQFEFFAPATFTVAVTKFTLFVTLDVPLHVTTRQVAFPLRLPVLPPAAAHSYMRCADEMKPVVCTVAAADAVGPVLYNMDDFAIGMETTDEEEGGTWYDNAAAFDFRYSTANTSDSGNGLVVNPARRDLGLVSWFPRVNSDIRRQRFHVMVRHPSSPGDTVGEIRGSPYEFMSGVVPTAPSVTLRGCNVTAVRGGHNATCNADLSNGVSGDTRYFHFHSTGGGRFSGAVYIPQDPVTRARTVAVTYTAPTVKVRTDDFISLHILGTGEAVNSPFRMNVFPVPGNDGGANGGSGADGSGTAAVVGVGIAFYGSILTGGVGLIVRRSRTIRRIRRERAAKRAWQAAQQSRDATEAPPEEEEQPADAGSDVVAGGDGGHSEAGREDRAQPSIANASRQTSEQLLALHTGVSEVSFSDSSARPARQLSRSAAGGSSAARRASLATPPRAGHPRGVVSNAPVDQMRMHSDSD